MKIGKHKRVMEGLTDNDYWYCFDCEKYWGAIADCPKNAPKKCKE